MLKPLCDVHCKGDVGELETVAFGGTSLIGNDYRYNIVNFTPSPWRHRAR
jgi:hypothetical protein